MQCMNISSLGLHNNSDLKVNKKLVKENKKFNNNECQWSMSKFLNKLMIK